MYWYEKNSEIFSPVISTRVRFARNLDKLPFPQRLGNEGRKKLFGELKKVFEEKEIMSVPFENASEEMKYTFVQTHLASMNLIKEPCGSGLLLPKNDASISIMINEEDHLRIQSIESGFDADKAYKNAKKWTDFAEEKLDIAYSEDYGYLTSCPTNLGAAMRISVMIHLPSIAECGRINMLIHALGDAGYTVRGMFGEGTSANGRIYQISNQASREKSEEEIISDFKRVIDQVIEEENKCTKYLIGKNKTFFEDRMGRAMGNMMYARRMSFSEFLSLYSIIRQGREMGFELAEKLKNPDRLLIELMPYPMIMKNASLSDEALRDEERSRVIRENLK